MIAAFVVFGFLSLPQMRAQFVSNPVTPASTAIIPEAQWLTPEALLPMLKGTGADKPLVLQVGSHVLFAQSHIAGSEYVGPGSQPAGLEQLSRKKLIMLYCGCCPWNRCPNLGPAYAKLREMGFTNAKVLYLADNFGTDWANKGYPVEQGK
jgi:hypothetical protein